MRAFFGAFAAVMIAMCVVAVWHAAPDWRFWAPRLGDIALRNVIAPCIATVLVFLIVVKRSPRRLFDRRTRRPVVRATLGVIAALGGLVVDAVVSMKAPMGSMLYQLPEAVRNFACAGLSTLIVLLPLPRVPRRGHCFYCDYDLQGTPEEQVCPECGKADGRQ